MTPYTAPGISELTEDSIIRMVSSKFSTPPEQWMNRRARSQKEVVVRQVFHCCLIDYMGYSLPKAGATTHQDHCTALHGRNRVRETLVKCKDVGPTIKEIFSECESIQNMETISKLKTNDKRVLRSYASIR